MMQSWALDEPQSAKPAKRSCRTGPPGYTGRLLDTVPAAYVDWRACTATPLSRYSSKTSSSYEAAWDISVDNSVLGGDVSLSTKLAVK